MKNWKKKLLSELDDRIPELREDVKNAPIRVASFTADENTDVRAKKEEEKKENGIEFRPFYPETENRPEITYNLDLFGGIFTQMYNTQNNI